MKRAALAIAFLLIAAGGAIAVMKYLEVGIFAPPPGAEEVAKVPDPPKFVDMDPLVVNIFDGSSVTASVQIIVKLQVVGDDNYSFVYKRLPKISHAFLQDMHSFLPRLLKRNESNIDVFVIKKRLKLVADRLYPEQPVNDVLIQAINEN